MKSERGPSEQPTSGGAVEKFPAQTETETPKRRPEHEVDLSESSDEAEPQSPRASSISLTILVSDGGHTQRLAQQAAWSDKCVLHCSVELLQCTILQDGP